MNNRPQKPTLREAAEAAVNVLEDLGYDPVDLRNALAEPQITTPDVCGEVCARAKLCYGCNNDLEESNASWMSHDELKAYWSGYGNGRQEALAEQAKQEPVAFYIYKPTPARFDQFKGGVLDGSLPWVYDQDPSTGFVARMLVTPCAAPVRTKDLTKEEKAEIVTAYYPFVYKIIDAVIAADREKNK